MIVGLDFELFVGNSGLWRRVHYAMSPATVISQ